MRTFRRNQSAHGYIRYIFICMMILLASVHLPGLMQTAYADIPATLYIASKNEVFRPGYLRALDIADGASLRNVLTFPEDDYPSGIAVDQDNGYIYFDDRYNRIYRAKLDGSEKTQIYQSDENIVKLALDPARGRLYFTESYYSTTNETMESKVKFLNLSDSTTSTIYYLPGRYIYTAGIAIVPNGDVYFSYNDFYQPGIYRYSDAEGAASAISFGAYDDYNAPRDVAVDVKKGRLYYSQGGSVKSALLTNPNVQTTLYDSPGNTISAVTVDESAGKIYFAVSPGLSLVESSVYQMNADGSGVTHLFDSRYVDSLAIAEAPPTYKIAPIDDITLARIAPGYAPASQETRSITVTRTGTGVLQNLSVALSGSDAGAFEVTSPSRSVLNDTTPTATFTVRAKNGLPAGMYTATVSVTADSMMPVTFEVTQEVHSYTIAALADVELAELDEDYAPGTTEARDITLTRTGTGVLHNVSVAVSGPNADAFKVTPLSATTLDGATSNATFTVRAEDGLPTGTYTAAITVTADKMTPVTFAVRQTVHSYSMAAIADVILTELESGYDPATQETRSITLTRTGTGALHNVAIAVGGSHADAFEATPPSATTLDGTTPTGTFTVQAEDNLPTGTYTATVTITADKMTPMTFMVTQVVRPSADASLSGLHVSAGGLDPVFHPAVTEYTVQVPYHTNAITIGTVTNHEQASVLMLRDGQPTTNSIALDTGLNEIEIVVMAENGTETTTYKLAITRAYSSDASLGTLSLVGIALNETVSSDVYRYTATVTNEVDVTRLHVTPFHPDATIEAITLNGQPITDPIPLHVGSNVIDIVIRAQDGVTLKNYTVTIEREASSNARLKQLIVDQRELRPNFDPDHYSYILEVPYLTEQISVTASVYHELAELMMNGQVLASGASLVVPLDVGSNIVNLTVTAENKSDTVHYTLVIERAANDQADLSGLVLADGTVALHPDFSTEQLIYQVEVPHSQKSITVKATVEGAGATLRVNGQPAISGMPTDDIDLQEGDNPIIIEVMAQNGQVKKQYQILITRLQEEPDPSEEEPPSPEDPPEEPIAPSRSPSIHVPSVGIDVWLNGTKIAQSVKSHISTDNGQKKMKVMLHSLPLGHLLGHLEDEGELVIAIGEQADIVSIEWTAAALRTLEMKRVALRIETSQGQMHFPATALKLEGIISMFEDAQLDDIQWQVTIAESGQSSASLIEQAAAQRQLTMIGRPVEFTVTVSVDDHSIELTEFNRYMQKVVPLPEGVYKDGITTAAVSDKHGSLRHVPTFVRTLDGKAYANISSLTNGTYVLIHHSVRFPDMEHHWAEEAVHDLASRLVVNGMSRDTFQPDRAISRAEFAAIAVQALGLPEIEGESSTFYDVQAGDWFAGAVATARRYGIINGYDDGTYRPSRSITREEAIVMLERMMKLVAMEPTTNDPATMEAEHPFATYRDSALFSEWAQTAAAATVRQGLITGHNGELRPADEITRAETTVIIQRLLQQAGIITD